ncbi:Response regulator receiver domain-containing protein [Pricia antarctica]|uniref:Response regulator receiver domain-containing protein n=1 Tax=Pricia antarctica TaxID=641691 RepID=A0A1G7GGL4_9FLAO|nr:response regulator [Pricia antarctica]SDE87225.1 Response regulator receiver domain-containing protein [Pricia antarctica]
MINICIIDDDPITVFGIRKMLSSITDGNEVSSYANGKLALDGIKAIHHQTQEIPDVIFLDINMPIMDGWQFLEEFIALPLHKKVRINIYTSSIDPYDLQTYEKYKKKTDHTLTYNNKPILKSQIEAITEKA